MFSQKQQFSPNKVCEDETGGRAWLHQIFNTAVLRVEPLWRICTSVWLKYLKAACDGRCESVYSLWSCTARCVCHSTRISASVLSLQSYKFILWLGHQGRDSCGKILSHLLKHNYTQTAWIESWLKHLFLGTKRTISSHIIAQKQSEPQLWLKCFYFMNLVQHLFIKY